MTALTLPTGLLYSNTTQTRRTTMTQFNQELDASGLNCPLPILRAKKSLAAMNSGEVLHIIATDPGSVKDFESFTKQTGNELMQSSETGGKFTFLIKKS